MRLPNGPLLAFAACLLLACAPPPETYVWRLPVGVPPPTTPADNPMTEAKVALGRRLFYDPRLSANQTQSCSTCHQQQRAFSEGRMRAVGSTGEQHRRNTMALVNVAYNGTLTWAHPQLRRLERQHLIPLFGDDPLELGLDPANASHLERISGDQRYQDLFGLAFPYSASPVSYSNVVKALASFSRSLVSFDSAFDRYAYAGEDAALSASALRGMGLFFSERLECHHCHGGFNFSESTTHENAAILDDPFHNTGLYMLNNDGGYPLADPGLSEHTQRPQDQGKFRAPTLRNIEVTAPYMHDGSIGTLEEVIDFYGRGGRLITEGANAGDGALNLYKSAFVNGFELNAAEKEDLMAFLHSLTDETFLANEAFSNPD
jgi:cytochrome c peroxidase